MDPNPDPAGSQIFYRIFSGSDPNNLPREAKYAKNHFQQNRYSVFESHVMLKKV